MFPLDDNFVFGDNFFFWLLIFFSPKATKKITQPRKKITHQQTKLLIQRKPHYIYDMTFLCPPPLFGQKKYMGALNTHIGARVEGLLNTSSADTLMHRLIEST